MPKVTPQADAAVATLCPSCGLCCNGVLFGDVQLQRGDSMEALQALGLPIERVGRKARFPQPCACFDGQWCRVYPDRPVRCQTFACRVLLRVQHQELTVADGLKRIQETKQLAEKLLKLLRRSGNHDEHLSLSKRYAQVMALPIDLTVKNGAKLRGELMLAVHELMQVLQTEFLT